MNNTIKQDINSLRRQIKKRKNHVSHTVGMFHDSPHMTIHDLRSFRSELNALNWIIKDLDKIYNKTK